MHAERERLAWLADRGNQLAAALLVGTVTFNSILAVINGHVIGLSNTAVVAVQATLVFAAMGVAIMVRPAGIALWIAFAWVAVLLNFVLMLFRGAVDPKPIGDILIIPAFVSLGMCIRPPTLIKTLIVLQIVLVIFVVWELFAPTSFGDLFKVRDYYIATRGFRAEKFWAGTDNLFLSAQRPGGRLINIGLNINRGSSLFLEPVSLGNWTVVVMVAIVTFWKQLSRRDRTILLASNIILLIGCDGRLAMAMNLILFASMPLAPRLPRFFPALYLPGLFFALLILAGLGIINTSTGSDTIGGRYTNGVGYLVMLDLPSLLGVPPPGTYISADSGWSYIVNKQSIFGLMGIWLALTTMISAKGNGRYYVHGAATFVALAMPVSDSVLSIKMAATMWMIGGCVAAFNNRSEEQEEAPEDESADPILPPPIELRPIRVRTN